MCSQPNISQVLVGKLLTNHDNNRELSSFNHNIIISGVFNDPISELKFLSMAKQSLNNLAKTIYSSS